MAEEMRQTASRTVLVVEDEAITLEFLVLTLAKKYPGLTFYKALDGEQGLELFMRHQPGIVITDMNMPGMGGVQMVKAIRAQRPETRIVVVTGDQGRRGLEALAGEGFHFDVHLGKPIVLADLFAALEGCLRDIGVE